MAIDTTKEQEETKRNIISASKTLIPEIDRNKFIEFMSIRFKEYVHISYAMQWAGRFNTKSPIRYMDDTTKRVFREIFKEE